MSKQKDYTVKEKLDFIARYKSSSKSQSKFCKENAIPTSTLSRWINNHEQLLTTAQERSLDIKRRRLGEFVEVETLLVEYIKLRVQKYSRDKCGLSYMLLHEKAMEFAARTNANSSFQASPVG